jgi:hypothetical protein
VASIIKLMLTFNIPSHPASIIARKPEARVAGVASQTEIAVQQKISDEMMKQYGRGGNKAGARARAACHGVRCSC